MEEQSVFIYLIVFVFSFLILFNSPSTNQLAADSTSSNCNTIGIRRQLTVSASIFRVSGVFTSSKQGQRRDGDLACRDVSYYDLLLVTSQQEEKKLSKIFCFSWGICWGENLPAKSTIVLCVNWLIYRGKSLINF